MSLADNVRRYYAARAPVYDESAGYQDLEAEQFRIPIKARYQEMFEGHDVLEIACGSGYWTAAVAETARSVLAVDVNASIISRAEKRCRHLSNVRFQIADAYSLEGVPDGFTAAFSNLWWSHVPVERLPAFLAVLHGKLKCGAFVLFADQLLYEGQNRRDDMAGNTLEKRVLPDGRSFEIVKNFPTEEGIRNVLGGIASNVEYIERPDEKNWSVTYNTKK